MKKYKVIISPDAEKDLCELYGFIYSLHLDTLIAKKSINDIQSKIWGLSTFPHSHQQRTTGCFANKGYRQLLIGKYVAIFAIDERKREVYILTIRHQSRNF